MSDKEINEVLDKESDKGLEENKKETEPIFEEHPESEHKEKKTAGQKFFELCDRFGDLFLLNILFDLTCIPIFTIGASITALYTVTNKMVKGEEGVVRDEYFKAFKKNFKAATPAWLIVLVLGYIVYVGVAYSATGDADSVKYTALLTAAGMILLSFLVPLLFPLIARYENSTFAMIKNTLIISVTNLGIWFRVFFVWIVPVILYVMIPKIFYYTWYIWLLFLMAFLAYVNSMSLWKLYEKLEARDEE